MGWTVRTRNKIRLNIRRPLRHREGDKLHYGVYCRGVRICGMIRKKRPRCWFVVGFDSILPKGKSYERRGDALRAIRSAIAGKV